MPTGIFLYFAKPFKLGPQFMVVSNANAGQVKAVKHSRIDGDQCLILPQVPVG